MTKTPSRSAFAKMPPSSREGLQTARGESAGACGKGAGAEGGAAAGGGALEQAARRARAGTRKKRMGEEGVRTCVGEGAGGGVKEGRACVVSKIVGVLGDSPETSLAPKRDGVAVRLGWDLVGIEGAVEPDVPGVRADDEETREPVDFLDDLYGLRRAIDAGDDDA